MDGYAGGVYYGFVEEYRRHVGALRAEIADFDRRAVEAWFQCIAFAGEDGFASDLEDARSRRDKAEADLASAHAALATAERRLARFERTLASLTSGRH